MKYLYATIILAVMMSCNNDAKKHQAEVQSFLDDYNKKYRELYTASSEGQWILNTHIVEGDTMNAYNSRQADEAMSKFTGSNENIKKANQYLAWEKELTPLQVKQLKKILYLAAGNPESAASEVKELIAAGTAQTEKLYGYKFSLDGKEVTPNDIDSILANVNDTNIRRKAWESAKAVGGTLKSGLTNLRSLRNGVVKGLGYSDFFTYQVSDYGMTKIGRAHV